MKFNNTCPHEKTTVSRMRGSRVRRKCDNCGHLGKWEKRPEVVSSEATKTVEKIDDALGLSKPDLNEYVVADLRDMAKRYYISGYSKMKKSELIDALKGREEVSA